MRHPTLPAVAAGAGELAALAPRGRCPHPRVHRPTAAPSARSLTLSPAALPPHNPARGWSPASSAPHTRHADRTDTESLLGGGFGAKAGRADKFGALEDEGAAPPSASERYREKHAKYFTKYGLR